MAGHQRGHRLVADLMRFVRWRKTEAPGPLDQIDIHKLAKYVDFLNGTGLAPSSADRGSQPCTKRR